MNAATAHERREELLPLIAPCYREKAQAMKNPAQSGQELAAGYLMYKVLGAGLDYVPALSPYGKPQPVGDMPCFNISHSDRWTVLAVSDRPVGVDIEKTGRVRLAAAKRILSRTHLDELENADESSQPEIFTRLWTRYEASIKLRGTGFSQGIIREPEDDPTRYVTLRWDDCIVSCASEQYAEAETEEIML